MSSIFMEFGVMTSVAFEFPAVWDKVFFSFASWIAASAWSFGILNLMPHEGPVHLLSFLILSRLASRPRVGCGGMASIFNVSHVQQVRVYPCESISQTLHFLDLPGPRGPLFAP